MSTNYIVSDTRSKHLVAAKLLLLLFTLLFLLHLYCLVSTASSQLLQKIATSPFTAATI